MGNILFLSFKEHLEQGAKAKADYFNIALRDQYLNLLNRIPTDRRIGPFEEFIERCFPSDLSKKYYISCPNFLRKMKKSNEYAPSFLNNVVLRPELTQGMKSILPDGQNVILIGDIKEGDHLKCMVIKGIEFIDSNMGSPHDIIVNDSHCCHCFEAQGRSLSWSIYPARYEDTYFTPDNINEIIQECYTVANPSEVIKNYEQWHSYVEFRKYYLNEQSTKNFKLDGAEYLDSYAVNKKEYRKNTMLYDDYVLDDMEDFKHTDMVVLDKQVGEAISFPLIRLIIDRNEKSFLAASILKGKTLVNEEEKKIRSLANDNVFISDTFPDSDHYNESLKRGYELGDRFRVTKNTIFPQTEIDSIERQLEKDIEKNQEAIKSKYQRIIQTEVQANLDKYNDMLVQEGKVELSKKTDELNNSLENDIKENLDATIINKIKQLKKDIANKLKKDKKESVTNYELRLEAAYKNINVRALYEERNREILKSLNNKIQERIQRQKATFKIHKEDEIRGKYHNDLVKDQIEGEKTLKEQAAKAVEKVKEEKNTIRFAIYFKIKEGVLEVSKKQKETISESQYIVYDKRAEEAKIIRQERALANFYEGYVKNPYLSTYLFSPKELQPVVDINRDWEWYLDTLNEKQKTAVKKAVASNGLFLLQGPPGTGKTQVIAETVAHLVKQGKKVLISSETHKAIDNVFERLPKIAEIVPIRLIPSQSKKDSEYAPENLVDNFYQNISANMLKTVERYNNFKKNEEAFKETFDRLKLIRSKIKKSEAAYSKIQLKMAEIDKKSGKITMQISALSDTIDDNRISIDKLRRTIRYVNRNQFDFDEDINQDILTNYYDNVVKLIDAQSINKENFNLREIVNVLMSLTEDIIDREIIFINPETESTKIKVEGEEIRNKIKSCLDDLYQPLPGKEDEINALRKQLAELTNQSEKDLPMEDEASSLKKIFKLGYLAEHRAEIKLDVFRLQKEIRAQQEAIKDSLQIEISKIDDKIIKEEQHIKDLKRQLKDYQGQLMDLQEDNDFVDVTNQTKELELAVDRFFKDFEIDKSYNSIDEALNIIKDTWMDLEKNFTKKEEENKKKIPIYEKISKYLTNPDVIKEDRKKYTKPLFENANVYGITCTSNDRFRQQNNKQLDEYNLDDIDIKTVGIDVVIIDEVSKSSFLDLLIPILYGKTVILVGDHRQLPPMYDLSKLREADFEGLDENIINAQINKQYTKLYETCFFKQLFEQIGDDYKIMLQQQYRCHEHIMEVFNHFYQGDLKLGFEGQNNKKKHNIDIFSKGMHIIEPSKHVYFVDCKKHETRDKDSTSIYNVNEANVVVELIKKINDYFKKHSELEKLSMGVICTYGDQAKKIKERMKQEKIKTDAIKTDEEKWIISTVDDFQGDERDIIILSTVRNPDGLSNPGFITAYQRINVALSRARRLLIIVGNRQYLETKGVIDLPDVYGRGERFNRKDFHVYEKIIDTIERKGRVIEDADILEDKEDRLDG